MEQTSSSSSSTTMKRIHADAQGQREREGERETGRQGRQRDRAAVMNGMTAAAAAAGGGVDAKLTGACQLYASSHRVPSTGLVKRQPVLDYRAQGSGADPGSWQSACR